MNLPKPKTSTFIKYLLSYILVFSMLVACFFMILRTELTQSYRTQQADRIRGQMEAICNHLNTELIFLNQIDDLIDRNPDITLATYTREGKYYRVVNSELKQYASSSTLIDSIVYYSKYSGHVFSTERYVSCDGQVFTLVDDAGRRTLFDPTPWLDGSAAQLVWLSDGGAEYLLHVPKLQSTANYIFFYYLDTGVFQSHIESLLSEEVPAVALLDSFGNPVASSGFDGYAAAVKELSLIQGIQPLSEDHLLFLTGGLRNGFFLAAVVSEDYLANQVNKSFMHSYLSLLALSVVGIVAVYIAMLFTYRPLHRLVQSLAHNPNGERNYLELLSRNYSDLSDRNMQLQQRLAGYRDFVHKDLLGSVLTQQFSVDPGSLDRILGALSHSREVMAIKVAGIGEPDRVTGVLEKEMAPYGSCILLQRKESTALYLILFSSEGPERSGMEEKVRAMQKEQGLMFAFSNRSGSVMDIPMLLKNAEAASKSWPRNPLAEYRESTSGQACAYPHDELNQLSALLKGNHFSPARELLEGLFARFDNRTDEGRAPAYFLSCIILDCLTIITNSMSKARIEFDTYAEVFSEAVNLCRNLQYSQNFDTLKSLVNELLFFYEKETMDRLLHITPLRQMLESNFCDPNFSIAEIAEAYHVSPSRMSTLFKKEMGVSFSDYIWKMRLERAQELLTSTELSVDEIGLQIGYLTPNSFRRKFKQETGMTPSQYRRKCSAIIGGS